MSVADGFEVAGAAGAFGPVARLVQGGQQHRCENCDDRNDDEELDQREHFSHDNLPLNCGDQ